MDGQIIMRDEVNEPLGLALGPAPAAHPAREGRFVVFATIPIVLAVAIGAFAFGRHGAIVPGELVAATTVPRPAPVRAEPAPSPSPKTDDTVQPPSTSANRAEAASGANVSRRGAADPPTPLIIDVQAALAAQKAAEPDGRR
jgi:hypothetical protein